MHLSFFLVVIWYLLLKSGDIEINPGPVLPFALMIKKLKLFDSRIKILHHNASNLAGQHLLLKELIQDQFSTITVLKSVMLKSKTTKNF